MLVASRPLYQHRGNVQTVAPATEPVTTTELKTYLAIDGTDFDTLLGDLIEEARQEIEDTTGIAMINQTWKLSLDNWPGYREPWWDGVRQGHINQLSGVPNEVRLPRYPLSSITSVTTYDEDSNSTSITVADVFDVDTQQRPGRIVLQSGQAWPVALRDTNAIEIVYVAGYGAAASSVPAPLRAAVRNLAAYLFEHRGECTVSDAMEASGAGATASRYAVLNV